MDLNPQTLENLQKVFETVPQVLAVYLYGSRIEGYHQKASDLDMAAVADDTQGINYGDLIFRVNQIIKDVETDLRIITRQTSPAFAFQVIKTGQCIYQKSDKEKVQFEARVLSDYYDGSYIRNIYNSYLKPFFERV